MRNFLAALAFAALSAAASCGGGGPAKAKEADAASQNARARVMAMDPTAMAGFLIDQVRNGEGGPRSCEFVFEIAEMGDVPDGAEGPHQNHIGARAYTLQCGEPGARGAQRYLVYLPRDRVEATVAPCASGACDAGFLSAEDAAPGVPPADMEK